MRREVLPDALLELVLGRLARGQRADEAVEVGAGGEVAVGAGHDADAQLGVARRAGPTRRRGGTSTSALKALRFSGRFSVMVRTWPSRSTRTAGSDMARGLAAAGGDRSKPGRPYSRRGPVHDDPTAAHAGHGRASTADGAPAAPVQPGRLRGQRLPPVHAPVLLRRPGRRPTSSSTSTCPPAPWSSTWAPSRASGPTRVLDRADAAGPARTSACTPSSPSGRASRSCATSLGGDERVEVHPFGLAGARPRRDADRRPARAPRSSPTRPRRTLRHRRGAAPRRRRRPRGARRRPRSTSSRSTSRAASSSCSTGSTTPAGWRAPARCSCSSTSSRPTRTGGRRRNRRQLAETHRCTWSYPWVFERWDRR